MPQKPLKLTSKRQRAKKKSTVKKSVQQRQTVQRIAARLTELSPEALRTIAEIVQDLLKNYELGNGEDLFDEEVHLLAGEIAGENAPSLQEVQRALAKIPGSLTAEFIAERGER